MAQWLNLGSVCLYFLIRIQYGLDVGKKQRMSLVIALSGFVEDFSASVTAIKQTKISITDPVSKALYGQHWCYRLNIKMYGPRRGLNGYKSPPEPKSL
jgi:hypothetical protein